MPKNETLYEGKDSNADKKEKDKDKKRNRSGGNRPVLKSNLSVGWLNFSKNDGLPYLNIQTAEGDFAMFFQQDEIDRLISALKKAKRENRGE